MNASLISNDELEDVFSTAKSFYLAFYDLTLPLGLDALDLQFFALAASEAGGFARAATAYALAVEPTLVWPKASPNPSPQE